VDSTLANAPRRHRTNGPPSWRIFVALARAGFRRFATYKQATLAAAFTNTVFGFLHCSVYLAVAAGAGGVAAGYRADQLALYVFVSQGLLGTVLFWGDTDLAERIATGGVVADLLRPVHPVVAYLATDLGRAVYAAATRFVIPLVVGAFAFTLYTPRHAMTYPLFAASVVVATVLSFGCRYLVNASAYWLLDARGPQQVWIVVSTVLSGLYFPLRFLPGRVATALWVLTPFPSMLQAPLDIVVERVPPRGQVALLAGQLAWAVLALLACRYVQARAERRLVVQGG
jgi:ABC-2 type transport system permease protein